MFVAIPKVKDNDLWDHQRAALDFAIDHLNTLNSPCLIRMPTGTGKTGVIACLTMISNPGTSLVLTPWAHLRNQMVADLKKGFWGKVDIKPKQLEIVSMFPSTAKVILQTKEPQVIVATFATLNDMRLDRPHDYEALAKGVSLVVVDEGHYEPAVEWGKSVKGLKAKTVLLTATPYRNDLKLFRITDSKRSTHHFTHERAVAKGIIRELRFEELNSQTDIPSLVSAFAKAWNAALVAKSLPSQTPRAIICCAGDEDIETAVTHLRKAGLNAIGIHEQFENSPKPEIFLKDVPDDPKSKQADIWVHQHKLTEGLDDHRFCCVALFTRIRNDRKLIQQIGRILRRESSDRKKPALLFAPKEFSAEAEWNAYLEFEPQLKLLEPQHFRDVVNTLLGAQPEVEYFEGRFRRRFQPSDLSTKPQVILPPSVLVRTVGPKFTLAQYIEDCTDTLNTEDAVILGQEINAPCQQSDTFALWVYASVRNSRLLQNSTLYEIKLETHCVVVAEGFVFVADSCGNYPLEFIEENTTSPAVNQLARYIGKDFRPTHVSVDSSIPYDTVLRGADLRGHNLLSIPASLTDRVQICRSARGSSKEAGRRYVGLSNGRVRKELSDEERRNFELKTFVDWAADVGKILKANVDGSALFQRYMPTCTPPANPVPKSICLDLLRQDVTLTLADGRECRMKHSGCDIQASVKDKRTTYTCSFGLDGKGFDNLTTTLRVEYHPAKRRFWFNKEAGASVRVSVENDAESINKSLSEFLNQKQDIVLIGLDDGEIVYQGRNFYKIDYTYAEQVLVDLIVRPQGASTCGTEKGTADQLLVAKNAKATQFPDGTIFRAIANRKIDLPFSDELLICDDLGSECADFVAANFTDGQLALIHAKAGDESTISASAFHDVVAQAMKNLVYLTRNSEVPKGVRSWRRGACWNKTGVSRLYRTKAGLPECTALWSKIKADIVGSSNPALYVVLATTGCCDVQKLKQAIADPKMRTPETAQLMHLLDGLNGYARQLGVRVVIRDLPYQAP